MNKRELFDDIKHTLRVAEAILEVLVLTVAYYLVWRLCYPDGLFPAFLGNGKYVLASVYALLIAGFFYMSDCFKFGHLKLTDVVLSQWISLCLVDFITYFQLCLIANVMISAWPMLVLLVISLCLSFVCAWVFTAIYHRHFVPRNMLLIYGTQDALNIKFKMEARKDKYAVTRVISIERPLEEIIARIQEHDAVLINDIPAQQRNDIMKYCYANGIRTYAVPKISDIIMNGSKEINLFDTPLRLIKGGKLTLTQRFMKRALDIAFSLLAILLFSPLMLVIAAAIKLEDGGPVLYKQKRVTRDGKVFDILKFRSMIVNAEKEGQVIPAVGNDPRITKVGSVIRKIRMDEIMQLFNILKGDMSVVGPRPERVEHVEKYSAEVPEWHFREKVKGGLTGYAQIFGKYNTSPYDKLRLDLMYIENYSFRFDLKLIIMTIRVLFSRESTEGFETQKAMDEKLESFLNEEKEDRPASGQ